MSAAAIKICATMAESDGEGITDNESNFESASYYLGRNLAREEDMAEIDAAAAGDDDVNEIPVWVRGETRWIAGVTEHTTAADLVEALLIDDRSLVNPATGTSTTTSGAEPSTAVLQQFVITERWRQMEQILEPKTKVWKIWKAWGEAQCEVSKWTIVLIRLSVFSFTSDRWNCLCSDTPPPRNNDPILLIKIGKFLPSSHPDAQVYGGRAGGVIEHPICSFDGKSFGTLRKALFNWRITGDY